MIEYGNVMLLLFLISFWWRMSEGSGTCEAAFGTEATVFVNGIFTPKDEENWAQTRQVLEKLFRGSAYHVHNPTLDVNLETTTQAVMEKHGKYAVGFSLLAVGLAAVDKYMDTGVTDKVVATTMDGIRPSLEGKADQVSKEMYTSIKSILQAKPCDSELSGQRIRTINLVAHSHGGWCAKQFIKNGFPEQLCKEYPGLSIRMVVMGCPVLVESGKGVHSLLQLHNELDYVSLRYENDPEKRKLPHILPTRAKGVFHSLKKYLAWLEEIRKSST